MCLKAEAHNFYTQANICNMKALLRGKIQPAAEKFTEIIPVKAAADLNNETALVADK